MNAGAVDDRRFVVLMTACIAPKPTPDAHRPIVRADPRLRLQDYATALRFWLQQREPEIAGIVFADNSGASLDPLRQIASPVGRIPVELLSMEAPPPPNGLSYGYSEFCLVNEALRQSRLLAAAPYFIKATGRYLFPDIGRLLRQLPTGFQVAIDCKGMRPFGWESHPLAPVALAIFARGFYEKRLMKLPAEMTPAPPWNRRQFIEHVLFDELYPFRHEPGVILRWPCNCEPVGIGANGDDYQSWRKRCGYAARALARVVAPALWI